MEIIYIFKRFRRYLSSCEAKVKAGHRFKLNALNRQSQSVQSCSSFASSLRRRNEDDLRFVRSYRPQTEGRLLRILLLGPAGAGKSSVINSVQSVVRGKLYRQALVDNTSHGSFTKEYTSFRIKLNDKSSCSYVFNDIMGLSSHGGVLVEDIKLALKGHVKDGYEFNPSSRLSEEDLFYNSSPTPNDAVHVLVSVVPADTLTVMQDGVLKKFREIREEATRLKIPQLALLTKIDMAFPEISDVKNVYKSQNLKNLMERFSATVGIPMNCVFPLMNYREEIKINNDIDSLILNALKHILQCGEDFFSFNQNQADEEPFPLYVSPLGL